LETIQSPSISTTNYENPENHNFPENNDESTDLNKFTSIDDVSDHDISLLSLLNSQNNESSIISDIYIENSTSLTDNQIHSFQDVQHHVPYSSRISSPLKLSYIPESISESEEETQIHSNTQIDNKSSVLDVINEALNQSTINELISEEPENVSHNEDMVERSEGRKESLFEPINRLKELMNSQPPIPDNFYPLEPLESNSENHSSQKDLPVENSTLTNHDQHYSVPTPTDNDNDSDNIYEELSIKFRKRRSNRLKKSMNSQPLESNSENHFSQEDSPVENSTFVNHDQNYSVPTQTDNDNNSVNIDEELSIKFRKRLVEPEALISADIKEIKSQVQRNNL